MSKVYIAGVVSLGGKLSVEHQELNTKRFFAAEDYLRERGHEPVNPLRLNPVSEKTNWQSVMRSDLKALLDCDVVYALAGWEVGVGSRIEVELARNLGMVVLHESKELL